MKRKLLIFGLLVAALCAPVTVPAQTLSTGSDSRITTNTTTTIKSQTIWVKSIVVNIEVAGAASNTLTIQDKSGTPLKMWVIDTTTVGNKLAVNFGDAGVKFTSGLDIVTATGTAPTANVKITYR